MSQSSTELDEMLEAEDVEEIEILLFESPRAVIELVKWWEEDFLHAPQLPSLRASSWIYVNITRSNVY